MDVPRSVRRLLVVHGSPRRGGNTDALAQMAAELLRDRAVGGEELEVRSLRAGAVDGRPCLSCGGCSATGKCILQDGMQEVYDAVRWADTLIVACPVYFASVSAQLKTVIDRFQCAWAAKYLLEQPWVAPEEDRRAVLLAAGGMKVPRHLAQVRDVVRSWLVVVNYRLAGDVLLNEVDERGAVQQVDGLDALLREAVESLVGDAPPPRRRAGERPQKGDESARSEHEGC